MHFIYLIIGIAISGQYVLNQVDYSCPDTYCAAFGHCPKFSCKGKDEKTFYNATYCGCCHKCVKELAENEPCQTEMNGINIPGTQCGPHLRCKKNAITKENTCVKISEVEKELKIKGCESKAVELRQKTSELATGEPIPECDELGDYAAKQCRNGTLCHCVDTSGKRIFGSATYDDSDDMDCLCSRQYNEVSQRLSELNYNIDPVDFLRCKSNGNYEPFQFVGNYTYCVNVTSGAMSSTDDKPVTKKDVDQLSCSKHKYEYISECHKRYSEAIKEIKELEESGYLVVGFDVPKCDIDGTYAPVQCLNSHCYCVNKKGEKYRNTNADRNDPILGLKQTCSCVRELELIRDIDEKKWDKVTELYSHYICDSNGNYLQVQCSESFCYCVDPITGFMVGSKAVLKNDAQAIKLGLPCYNDTRMDSIFLNN